MKVREIMTTPVESITPTTSLKTAARKMRICSIGALPVIENGLILGIITDRDISCNVVAAGLDSESTEAQNIMNTEVETCFEYQDIRKAAQLMSNKHVRRLPVLNNDRDVIGFVSVEDIALGSHDIAGAVLESANH